jgi:hypothetical protein
MEAVDDDVMSDEDVVVVVYQEAVAVAVAVIVIALLAKRTGVSSYMNASVKPKSRYLTTRSLYTRKQEAAC